MTIKETVDFACKFLSDKKADNVVTFDVAKMTIVADYFVIASGRTSTQVRAIAEYVEEKFSALGIEPRGKEGIADGRWAVLDYGDVIVHIFNEETRTFYCLERLWNNGENMTKYSD